MIETQNVSKHFGQVKAVEDVSLSIGRGEIVGLLGRNGAGKTTLVDLILGLTKPTGGTVRVANTTPAQAVREARIGAVMQTGGLLDTVTVKDTLAMIDSTHRDSIGVEAAIEHANLRKIQNRRVGKCSGGEQQRVRFAIALLGKPDILILDEPTTGMDATSRHEFWDTMRAQAHSGRTIIFSTHYLEEAENLAERIIVLDNGQVIADGPTDRLTADANKKRVTAQSSQGLIDVTTSNADSYARKLLNETDAHDLTITRTSLEDSFIALTARSNHDYP
ncbi:ABC-2 type transport system ATP-binding protein [Corynebacterium appendicis CIP 107643]|uniref:ABC-2 type transport system ATP-binding protein n=1 Tax=Corynebacterium appendicis CIP 107643 TaxID=1161099 RepID=A0A1N7KAH2_9CORY|nr:ABC transporter ATP-binding protein [Corynebacterium appendicis]MCT1685098.1 ABC transporter ATP-binding protein [Corynebacterium appendicis]WJY60512.1 Daunorubicin/doxorubicin resistance ATP-binding protein DrrA [Corynebacterium appendicis CIP 107643]SIS58539.1 ABC-2 type transport system ATP-binding protein [Corynebacterium appendicis CIP 107643]